MKASWSELNTSGFTDITTSRADARNFNQFYGFLIRKMDTKQKQANYLSHMRKQRWRLWCFGSKWTLGKGFSKGKTSRFQITSVTQMVEARSAVTKTVDPEVLSKRTSLLNSLRDGQLSSHSASANSKTRVEGQAMEWWCLTHGSNLPEWYPWHDPGADGVSDLIGPLHCYRFAQKQCSSNEIMAESLKDWKKLRSNDMPVLDQM